MYIFFTTLLFTLTQLSACDLDEKVIDYRTHADLRYIAHNSAKKYKNSSTHNRKELSCLPKISYTQSRIQKKSVIKSAFCAYQKRFLNPYRVKKGKQFLNKHRQTLLKAQAQFGVDPYIITAIIGVESNYGSYTGKYVVKHALATIATQQDPNATITIAHHRPNSTEVTFETHSRKEFFMDELAALLKIGQLTNIDLDTLLGSWDGGIGLAQFMPTSYLKYAISDKNEHPDLFDADDAIMSIANYLKDYGQWQPGPIIKRIQQVTPELIAVLNDKQTVPYTETIFPSFNTNQPLHAYRFLMDDDSESYWLTYHNFNAIRTYNPRPHYAMNVTLLAEAIYDTDN